MNVLQMNSGNVFLMVFSLSRNLCYICFYVHCDFAFRCPSVKLSSLFTAKLQALHRKGKALYELQRYKDAARTPKPGWTTCDMSFVMHECSLHHFTRGPYVSGCLAAVTGQQPDQRRLDGPAIPSSHCFHGEPFWPFVSLTFGAGGSSEAARWWSVPVWGILRRMCPCFHVSKCWSESLWGRQSQMVQVRCFNSSLQFVCDLRSKLDGNCNCGC